MTTGGRVLYHAPLPIGTGMQLIANSAVDGIVAVDVPPAHALFVVGSSVLAAWEELDGTRLLFHTLSAQ